MVSSLPLDSIDKYDSQPVMTSQITVTVPGGVGIGNYTRTSPVNHPTSPVNSTAVYRGFPALRDHRNAPYPVHLPRYMPTSSEAISYQTVPIPPNNTGSD